MHSLVCLYLKKLTCIHCVIHVCLLIKALPLINTFHLSNKLKISYSHIKIFFYQFLMQKETVIAVGVIKHILYFNLNLIQM